MLAPIEYLDWYRSQQSCAHDLGGTDLRRAKLDEQAVIPASLESLSPPPDGTIGSRLAAEYEVETQCIALASGARHAYLLAIMAAMDGTEAPTVLVENPAFEPLHRTPAGLGAHIERFAREPPTFDLNPDRIAASMTEATTAIVITNRHNPSGHYVDRARLREIAELAAEHGAYLVSDEVYAPYTSQPRDGPFGGVTAAGLPNSVVVSSITKFFGLGELRLGWLVVPETIREIVGACTMHFPTVGVSNRVLAHRALASERLVSDGHERIQRNHELLAEFVSERSDLDGTVHPGATFAFLAHRSIGGSELSRAAGETGIRVIPGRFFGDPARVRVGLGGEPESMRMALEAFGSLLNDLS